MKQPDTIAFLWRVLFMQAHARFNVCTATKGACYQISKAQQKGSSQVAFVFTNTLTDLMAIH